MALVVENRQGAVDPGMQMDGGCERRCFSEMGNSPSTFRKEMSQEGPATATRREEFAEVRAAVKPSGDGSSVRGDVAAATKGGEGDDGEKALALPSVEDARAKVAEAFARNSRAGETTLFGRTRSTPLGEIEWDLVDPLALSKADRRQAEDLKYNRPNISAAQMDLIKQKWQARQVKRVSNAARLYGARESQRELWEFLAVHEKEKQQRDERGSSQSAASSSSPAARAQGVKSAAAGGDWGTKDQAGKGHASMEGGIDYVGMGSGAQTAPGGVSTDSKNDTVKQVAPKTKSTLKTISKAFKNMMGSQKPGKVENLLQRMNKSHVPSSYMDTV